ncbi:MAG: DUF2459 domain-containing protein [Colwellia sp.]|nr:DUF2459 domain-containing protein [Colwellia sp.]
MRWNNILLLGKRNITGKKYRQMLLLVATVFCSACAVKVVATKVWDENQSHKTIYLVNHGWHAGIVLHQSDMLDSDWPAIENFPKAQYLEIGWGDSSFYQSADPHLGLILKAALLPTDSILHLVGFDDAVASYFPNSEIISITLTTSSFTQLSRTIATSFALNETAQVKSLGVGLYGNSHFYPSKERYHLFNTCNVWVAKALHSAGLPITPARAMSVQNLMYQVREFGKIIQENP